MKVLGRASSMNVRKVLWTLDELGLGYDREDWGMGFTPTDRPEFLALIDDHGPLWESNTICRYLAQRYGDGFLLPADPRGRAGVEQWMDWQATELNPTWRYAFLALSRKTPGFDDPEQIAASTKAWNRQMALLEDQLNKTGAYAAGEAFSLADVCLGLSTHRWMATPIERAELPAVVAYYERLRERVAFLPHARIDVA
jgi:glutathione S-transferase